MNECSSPNFVSGLMVAGGAAGRGAAPATRRARPARRPSAKSTNGGHALMLRASVRIAILIFVKIKTLLREKHQRSAQYQQFTRSQFETRECTKKKMN